MSRTTSIITSLLGCCLANWSVFDTLIHSETLLWSIRAVCEISANAHLNVAPKGRLKAATRRLGAHLAFWNGREHASRTRNFLVQA